MEQHKQLITRVALTDEDFEDLIAGRLVVKGDVEIVMEDIGFQTMKECIADAEADAVFDASYEPEE